jgi:hypothetical protein
VLARAGERLSIDADIKNMTMLIETEHTRRGADFVG